MREVRRTPAAERDLDEIWLRIAVDNPRAAETILRRLEEAEARLLDFPEQGEARPEIAPELRKWTVRPYVIFYRLDSRGVTVVRVLHGARELPPILDLDQP